MLKFATILFSAALLAGCENINSEPPDIQTMHEMRPAGAVKDLNVALKIAVGNIEVRKISDDNLFSLDLQYDRHHYTPRFNFDDGDHASLRLDLDGQGGSHSGGGQD